MIQTGIYVSVEEALNPSDLRPNAVSAFLNGYHLTTPPNPTTPMSHSPLHRPGPGSPSPSSEPADAPSGRRRFLRQAGLGGLALGLGFDRVEDDVAFLSQRVNRNSAPTDLKITDLRIAVVDRAPMRCPMIRIDTNQGIYGLGEVRDGGSERYALVLKSRLLGHNPCSVEFLFKRIKQFGHHGRQGGGVSGVEMALWDLAGKA